MCWYKLDICPYPDQDPISALIFNPAKADGWEFCNKVKPWGRLSCGCLVIEHPNQELKPARRPSVDHILATQTNKPVESEQPKHLAIPIRQKRSSTETTIVPSSATCSGDQVAQCLWCTAVLKLVSTKSKEIQGDARKGMAELEKIVERNPEWLKVQNDIREKQQELAELKQIAWNMFGALINENNAEDEAED